MGFKWTSSLVLGSALLASSSLLNAADTLQDIMKKRGLSEKDILAAAKTYTPSGMKDAR